MDLMIYHGTGLEAYLCSGKKLCTAECNWVNTSYNAGYVLASTYTEFRVHEWNCFEAMSVDGSHVNPSISRNIHDFQVIFAMYIHNYTEVVHKTRWVVLGTLKLYNTQINNELM